MTRRLVLEGPAKVRWEEVDYPELHDPAAAIVRPVAVATCDLDVGVLRGTFPLAGPYPFGHEGVAEVVQVGDEVTSVAPGDVVVVVPFQISCGQCLPCRKGRTSNCASHPKMSTFGLGAMEVSNGEVCSPTLRWCRTPTPCLCPCRTASILSRYGERQQQHVRRLADGRPPTR